MQAEDRRGDLGPHEHVVDLAEVVSLVVQQVREQPWPLIPLARPARRCYSQPGP